MVWACNTLGRTYKDNPARNSPREEKTGQIRRRVEPKTSFNGQGKASLSLRQSPAAAPG